MMATLALPSPQRHPSILPPDRPEQRRGLAGPARSAQTLEHAITYLVQEQAGSFESNRQKAIVLLCSALGEIAAGERRDPAYRSIRGWLSSLAPLPRR